MSKTMCEFWPNRMSELMMECQFMSNGPSKSMSGIMSKYIKLYVKMYTKYIVGLGRQFFWQT